MTAQNVLLVTVDCMRRDRLSAYGYQRRTTPFFNSLLDRGLHCTSAHSTSSWTSPAVASMLTGLYPHHHGAGIVPGNPKNLDRDHLPSPLSGDIPALGRLLPHHASGCVSAVPFTALTLEDLPRWWDWSAQMDGGGPVVVDRALRWIREQKAPFFCWVHLGDAHDPLEVSRELRDAFGPVTSYRKARKWAFTKRDDDVGSKEFREYAEARTNLYDAAILAADTAIGDLWTSLDAMRDDTFLIVTADHGEELWEHRDEEIASFEDPRGVAGAGHGQNLWQEILLVPLLVHGPGVAPRAIEQNVSLVDVVPTILEAAGSPVPDGLDGMSLFGDVPQDRAILAEGIAYGHEKAAVIVGERKLLSSPGDAYERVFVLDDARTESVGDASAADNLRPLLPPKLEVSGPTPRLTGEMADHLRELGYIE